MNLKALARKVLDRDTLGTHRGTDKHNLSHSTTARVWDSGTVLPDHLQDHYEERSGILELDCGLPRIEAEMVTAKEVVNMWRNSNEK